MVWYGNQRGKGLNIYFLKKGTLKYVCNVRGRVKWEQVVKEKRKARIEIKKGIRRCTEMESVERNGRVGGEQMTNFCLRQRKRRKVETEKEEKPREEGRSHTVSMSPGEKGSTYLLYFFFQGL